MGKLGNPRVIRGGQGGGARTLLDWRARGGREDGARQAMAEVPHEAERQWTAGLLDQG